MAANVSPPRRRILLGQLVANGDCLFATAVARQIKQDEPDCHLTWAISAACRSVLNGNPHVDAVWEIPAFATAEGGQHWDRFEREARARQADGEFDSVYFTQFAPAHLERWDGTIRSSILAGYGRPITVPLAPVVRLSAEEIENVQRFAAQHRLPRRPPSADGVERPPVILVECAPKSGQSFVTPDYALEVARALTARFPELRVILSSNIPIREPGERILDGSTLSFRENAEITHYCTIFIGCSSGISWLCTSDWARKLPMIQLLSRDAVWRNSLIEDHTRHGLATDAIIELFDCPATCLQACVEQVLTTGWPTRQEYPAPVLDPFHTYRRIQRDLLYRGSFRQAAHLFRRYARRLAVSPGMLLWHVPVFLKALAARMFRRNRPAP